MFRYFLPKVLKLLLLVLIVVTFLVLGNLYTYQRLSYEKPIAQLSFIPVANQEYDAYLTLGNDCESSIYRIYGDEWRIDAQFLKWKSWATLFGLNSNFRIDRLSGRYSKINDENTKPHSAHDLSVLSTLNLSSLAERHTNNFLPVDTFFGSSVYEKAQENILYTVFVTQSGLLIRKNHISNIEKNTECDGKAQWKQIILNLDQRLAGLIRTFK